MNAHVWRVSRGGEWKTIHLPGCRLARTLPTYKWLGVCTLLEAAKTIGDDPDAWKWHRGCSVCVPEFERVLASIVAINEGITS